MIPPTSRSMVKYPLHHFWQNLCLERCPCPELIKSNTQDFLINFFLKKWSATMLICKEELTFYYSLKGKLISPIDFIFTDKI